LSVRSEAKQDPPSDPFLLEPKFIDVLVSLQFSNERTAHLGWRKSMQDVDLGVERGPNRIRHGPAPVLDGIAIRIDVVVETPQKPSPGIWYRKFSICQWVKG